MIATMIRNRGKRVEISIIAPITLKEVSRNMRKESAKPKSERLARPSCVSEVKPGRTLSILSISLDNRFIIQPRGYVY